MVEPSDTTIHGGTLDGIVTKLDYLSELGVTTIWVTPGCLQTMNCLAHGLSILSDTSLPQRDTLTERSCNEHIFNATRLFPPQSSVLTEV